MPAQSLVGLADQWLQVDFGEQRGVYRVIIFGRYNANLAPRLNDIEVRIGDVSQTPSQAKILTDIDDNPLCGILTRLGNLNPQNAYIDCPTWMKGRYLTIQKTNLQLLRLTEVFIQDDFAVVPGSQLEGETT